MIREDRQAVIDPGDHLVVEDRRRAVRRGHSANSWSDRARSADADESVGREQVVGHREVLAAPALCGCGPTCRTASRGRGRTSRRTRRAGSPGLLPSGTQPRWVQTPTMISHSGRTFLAVSVTRALSVCGSRSSDIGTASASLISSGVRWRMKTGLPRHFTVIAWPTCDRRHVHLDRGQRQRIGGGIEIVDEGPGRGDRADRRPGRRSRP